MFVGCSSRDLTSKPGLSGPARVDMKTRVPSSRPKDTSMSEDSRLQALGSRLQEGASRSGLSPELSSPERPSHQPPAPSPCYACLWLPPVTGQPVPDPGLLLE